MKNKLILTLSLVMVCVTVSAQFADTDTLRRYNNRWITNNSGTAFTNLRLHTLLEGMIDFIDTALNEAGGSFSGIDSVAALNDSTIRYRKNGVFRSFKLRGNHWNLQNILNHGSTLTENETITLLDSLRFELGKIILDTLRIRHLQEVNDTTLYKPVVKDISGNLYAFDRWPGAATLENAAGSGDTLLVGPTTIKRLDHDQTITFSINANKILIAVDTPNYISTHSKLRDTAAVLRGLIGAGNTSSQGIRKNVNNFELGDAGGENLTTFTRDTYLRSGNRTIYLQGNKTNSGDANITFDDTLTATDPTPVFKTWVRYNSLNHALPPYLVGTGNINDGSGGVNHTFNRGFNFTPMSTRFDNNYVAIGESMEGSYLNLVEWHKKYIDRNDQQLRIESYLIDTSTDAIELYHEINTWYLKRTYGGTTAAQFLYSPTQSTLQLTGNGPSLNLTTTTNTASLSPTAPLTQFSLSNFNNWDFPYMRYNLGHIGIADAVNPIAPLTVAEGGQGAANHPDNVAVFERNNSASSILGVYSSAASPVSAARPGLEIGWSNYTNVNGYYPNWEWQGLVVGSAVSQQLLRLNAYQKDAGGNTVLDKPDILFIRATGQVGINMQSSPHWFNINGTVNINKDSLPIVTSDAGHYVLLQDTVSGAGQGQVKRILPSNLSVGPKLYTSLLTQAGTSDPTAIVLGSNTVGSIAWARTGTGVYTGTLSGAFTVDKTWLNAHLSDQSGGTIIIAKLVRTDANTITLSTFNSLLAATDVFTQISIEVKVYP